ALGGAASRHDARRTRLRLPPGPGAGDLPRRPTRLRDLASRDPAVAHVGRTPPAPGTGAARPARERALDARPGRRDARRAARRRARTPCDRLRARPDVHDRPDRRPAEGPLPLAPRLPRAAPRRRRADARPAGAQLGSPAARALVVPPPRLGGAHRRRAAAPGAQGVRRAARLARGPRRSGLRRASTATSPRMSSSPLRGRGRNRRLQRRRSATTERASTAFFLELSGSESSPAAKILRLRDSPRPRPQPEVAASSLRDDRAGLDRLFPGASPAPNLRLRDSWNPRETRTP